MNSNDLEGLFFTIECGYEGRFKRPTDSHLKLWQDNLSDYTRQEVRDAYIQYYPQGKFPPTLADLLTICKEKREHKAERERTTRKNVYYIAERAINTSCPSISLEGFTNAKKVFIGKCYKAENPARAALKLEQILTTSRTNKANLIEVIEGADL